MLFSNVLIRGPFSKSTVFKMCRFRVNGRPIRHMFHRFRNVPVSKCASVVSTLSKPFSCDEWCCGAVV